MASRPAKHGLASVDSELVQRGSLCWTLDGSLIFMSAEIPVRMTVIGIPPSGKQKSPKKGAPPPQHDLVVVSPLEPTPEVVKKVQALGTVKFIVAPNGMHHLFAGAFKAAFPGSKLIAPADLKARVPDVPVDHTFPALPSVWPADQVSLVSVPFVGIGVELVLVHKPSGSLVVTDLCFNFGEAHARKLNWFMHTYMWATGGYAKCSLTKPFKWMIKDPGALLAALDKLLTLSFDQLIMAHGEVLTTGGKQALREGTYAFVQRVVEQRAQPSLLASLSAKVPASLSNLDAKYLAVGGLAAGAAAVVGYALVTTSRKH